MHRIQYIVLLEELPETFTKEQVDQIQQEHKAKLKEYQDLAETLRTKATLTTKEKETYEAQLKDMRSKLMTTEELAKEERERQQREATEALKSATTEAETWRDRFTTSLIDREIQDAAVTLEAFNPGQIVSILRPNAMVAEAVDEKGKPNGQYVTQLNWAVKDETGKSTTLKLTPAQVVKKMSEDPQYINLFKSILKKGTNFTPGEVSDKSLAEAAKAGAAEYRKQRGQSK